MDPRYRPMPHATWRRRVLLRELRILFALVLAWGIMDRWGGTYALLFVGAFTLVVVVTTVWRRQRARALPALRRGVELFDAGLTDEALAVYERELDGVMDFPAPHSIVVMHIARAIGQKGRCEEALSMLELIHEEGWLYADGEHYGLAASVAAAHASLGAIEDATRWQKVARGRVPVTKRHHLVVLDAVLEAQRGRYTELAERLDAAWPDLERELANKAYPLKVLRLLRAFALDRSGSAEARALDVGALIAAAKGTKGDLSQHRAHFPAFDTFLASHGIE